MYCSNCGMNNLPESKFCQGCGAPLGPVPAPAPAPGARKGLSKPLLWVLVGLAVIALAATLLVLLLRDDPAREAVPASAELSGGLFPGMEAAIANPFTDLTEDKYYYDAVLWAYSSGITSGIDETHFGPDQTCTRAQVLTFLWNAFGKPEPGSMAHSFEDVKPDRFYTKAVLWAVEKGISGGVDDTHFGTDKPCTRAQVVTFLWNAYGKPEPRGTELPFTDVKPDKYYAKAILWAVEAGMSQGVNEESFAPNNVCTRAQVVYFLYLTKDLPKP